MFWRPQILGTSSLRWKPVAWWRRTPFLHRSMLIVDDIKICGLHKLIRRPWWWCRNPIWIHPETPIHTAAKTELRNTWNFRPSELLHDHHHDIPGSHRPWQSMTEVAWKLSTKFSGILHRKHLSEVFSQHLFLAGELALRNLPTSFSNLVMKLSNWRQ